MKTTHEAAIFHTLSYFGHFTYAPTLSEIHTHLPVSLSIRALEKQLVKMYKFDKIILISFHNSPSRYTLPQYSITAQSIKKRLLYTEEKEKRAKIYIFLLSRLPSVLLIGFSGSVGSYNASKNDDIDLFFITKTHKMWSIRAAAVLLAYILRLKRARFTHHAPNKVCTNLWFEEANLQVPRSKRSEYVAYEVLRMRHAHQKQDAYRKYLYENKWIKRHFPNITIHKSMHIPDNSLSKPGILERILKNLQLFFISKHKTTEYIAQHQLWFFPDDYAQKIPQSAPIDAVDSKNTLHRGPDRAI